jgi:hypothetical protein
MRVKSLTAAAVLCLALLAGCTAPVAQTSASPTVSHAVSPGASQSSADTATSASLVNTAAAFKKAISKDGTWIIALLNDLTIDEALTVDGDFKNTKTPPASQRKLSFYAQDENRKITESYTLTAPKMTISSVDCAIWNGTFRGDLYITAKNFQLIGATVDGNIYFMNADAQSTFKMDDASKVTGVQQLKTL